MEELLRGNLEGIKSFDANKDGAIDEKELKVAAQTSQTGPTNRKNTRKIGSIMQKASLSAPYSGKK